MATPQTSIFALGAASHAYLEFDLRDGADRRGLVRGLPTCGSPGPRSAGSTWSPGCGPSYGGRRLRRTRPPTRPDSTVTSPGAAAWSCQPRSTTPCSGSGSAYDVVFDVARHAIAALSPVASLAEETSSWPYRHGRDLTGFIDGTENPSLLEAPELALVPAGEPGEAGSVLLLQKWAHDPAAWESLAEGAQEAVIGRTKSDSIELDPRPADSHVARTDQEDFGDIFRRNMPYGTVTDHGTMFVGFSAVQRRLVSMLESMVGLHDGVPDALMRYTQPLTGAIYFVPSTEAIRSFATDEPGHPA